MLENQHYTYQNHHCGCNSPYPNFDNRHFFECSAGTSAWVVAVALAGETDAAWDFASEAVADGKMATNIPVATLEAAKIRFFAALPSWRGEGCSVAGPCQMTRPRMSVLLDEYR